MAARASLASLAGEVVLEAGVAELVDRACGAEDVALAGIFEEPHQPQRRVPANGELGEREAGRPAGSRQSRCNGE
jgi:hypothetical protein